MDLGHPQDPHRWRPLTVRTSRCGSDQSQGLHQLRLRQRPRLEGHVGRQARKKDAPFAIADWSIKEESRGWKKEARERIRRSDVVIVICGLRTHQAVGVATEVAIAREAGRSFYLLRGRKGGWARKPGGTFWETMYPWTGENLRAMTTGKR